MFGVDELGMDLGTSTLHIVVRGKGIVLSEPAYVAYDRQTRNVVAVGEEARRMYGRTPAGLIVERPLRDGRIRSFDLVSKMLRYFMRKVIGKRATFRPKLLLALPGGMAPSERQTLVDVLVDAGVRSVVPVDESVASAIGAAKPNPLMLEKGMELTRATDKRRALMLGDSLTSDIAAAKNAGIDACWFNPKGAANDKGLPIAYEIASLDEVDAILDGTEGEA